ncbi:MAG: hypothetical protein EA400_06730 [Chromatiaceae bacterium]|nr:MAG: hypothetical protein EA400_06730 [Chromatiaceae bacterium]
MPIPRCRLRSLGVLLLGLTSGPLAAAEQPVQVLEMTSSVPADWVLDIPDSDMRLTQFRIPARVDNDGTDGDGAEFVVFYFGPDQGGSVEANVARWVSQFSNPDGTPVEPLIERLETPMPATLVQLQGSYARGIGMGPVGDPLPDRMLLAAVVETPAGTLYPQLHGPAALVTAQRPAFIAFIAGLQRPGH